MSTFGGSDQPWSCFTWRTAFAVLRPRPASPCGDTDGYIEERRPPACARYPCALARLPWVWVMVAVIAAGMAKVARLHGRPRQGRGVGFGSCLVAAPV